MIASVPILDNLKVPKKIFGKYEKPNIQIVML